MPLCREVTVNLDPLTAHLSVSRYGSFRLTNAVRPALDVPIRPKQGYRIEIFRDRGGRLRLPMLSAAISSENLFDVFLALIKPLGEVVHAVLESSHGAKADRHVDLRRNHIDVPVLTSYLCEYEDMLLNDGCTGVAILAARKPVEVQFDEHKQLTVYAPDLKPFQRVLKTFGIRRRKTLPLLSEAEHLHHSTQNYAEQFRQLCMQIGVGDFDKVFSDESY